MSEDAASSSRAGKAVVEQQDGFLAPKKTRPYQLAIENDPPPVRTPQKLAGQTESKPLHPTLKQSLCRNLPAYHQPQSPSIPPKPTDEYF